ncbi:MAG: S8 family serine peptidase [Pyrinomonadaceae bacterium]
MPISTNDHEHPHTQNRYAVIPTAEKLNADQRTSGKGVTIAFLDSGFYPHPDIASRVIAFHDIHGEEALFDMTARPQGHHWHGTQTAVACAGDGSLSDGLYRGLASEAKLVLVKLSKDGRISDRSIEDGLRWVTANREKYNIRILNMSLGGDADLPTAESCVNRLVEELVASGVVVTVAAGNSANARSIPPANAPSVITVGGYSDENGFEPNGFDLYHSSYGETADGLVKPELIAPAMFVAAPILPGTADYERAEALSQLAAAPDYFFPVLMNELWELTGLDTSIVDTPIDIARGLAEQELRRLKIVATHYQHVDGTSFAAPIVASVVGQMIEANPGISPAAVKNILVSTATRLAGKPTLRQGFGMINAPKAVEMARKESHQLGSKEFFAPRIESDRIVFRFHDDAAHKVALCGDFNGWGMSGDNFRRCVDGLWHAEIRCRPAGTYRYKFLVDGSRWIEDPSHAFKEDDGHGGFNSLLTIG